MLISLTEQHTVEFCCYWTNISFPATASLHMHTYCATTWGKCSSIGLMGLLKKLKLQLKKKKRKILSSDSLLQSFVSCVMVLQQIHPCTFIIVKLYWPCNLNMEEREKKTGENSIESICRNTRNYRSFSRVSI